MKHTMIVLFLAASALVPTSCPGPSDGNAESPDYISPNIGTLKYVPAGSFQRDGTPDNISVMTGPFRISQTEITRLQFYMIMGTDPSDTASSSGIGDPVQMANWYHAIAFCNKLSIAEGLTPVYTVAGVNLSTLTFGEIPTVDAAAWNAAAADWDADGYRLPTEMEWMWAAMGADSGDPGALNTTGWAKSFAGSDGSNAVDDYAWTNENSTGTSHPAGTRLPNELGLHDMSGNVWEWCWDWNATYPAGTTTDHRGPASGTHRVIRGGCWFFPPDDCAVAVRDYSFPYNRIGFFGFRVVRP